jgi:tripartite-type tricarboxylate transporter receptor subunit TctC
LSSISSAQPHVRAGKLKAIASTGVKRAALFPELPTIAESGVPGYEAFNYWAIAAPSGTPSVVVKRLNTEVNAVLALAETQKRFASEGAETDSKTPTELEAFIKADIAKWARVARDAGMKRS